MSTDMSQHLRSDCAKCGPVWPCIDHYPSSLSPWAQEVVDRCKAEGRKATEVESFVLYAALANLVERAPKALGEPS